MDPQLFDAVWEVQREFGIDKPVHIISSYRSPRTNEMLRKRSSGVARHSLHMQGKAMDFFIPGVPLDSVREAGLRLQRGGVGFYPTSGSPFVHMDVGSVRHWPRMTREQLAQGLPGRAHRASADRRQAARGLRAGAGRYRASAVVAVGFEAARVASDDRRPTRSPSCSASSRSPTEDEDSAEAA